jgi:hypothetical protein
VLDHYRRSERAAVIALQVWRPELQYTIHRYRRKINNPANNRPRLSDVYKRWNEWALCCGRAREEDREEEEEEEEEERGGCFSATSNCSLFKVRVRATETCSELQETTLVLDHYGLWQPSRVPMTRQF